MDTQTKGDIVATKGVGPKLQVVPTDIHKKKPKGQESQSNWTTTWPKSSKALVMENVWLGFMILRKLMKTHSSADNHDPKEHKNPAWLQPKMITGP